jgi:hypothetical protein
MPSYQHISTFQLQPLPSLIPISQAEHNVQMAKIDYQHHQAQQMHQQAIQIYETHQKEHIVGEIEALKRENEELKEQLAANK